MEDLAEALSETVKLNDNDIQVRPICSEDVPLERVFLENLSPLERHFRFHGGYGQLSDASLLTLCDIDYEKKMVFIATLEGATTTEVLGIARYVRDSTGECEFAISVAEEWQQQGLGSILLDRLFEFARGRGETSLYTIDYTDDHYMRHLAEKFGMTMSLHSDDRTLEVYRMPL